MDPMVNLFLTTINEFYFKSYICHQIFSPTQRLWREIAFLLAVSGQKRKSDFSTDIIESSQAPAKKSKVSREQSYLSQDNVISSKRRRNNAKKWF